MSFRLIRENAQLAFLKQSEANKWSCPGFTYNTLSELINFNSHRSHQKTVNVGI